MKSTITPSSLDVISLISRGVFIELIRRKDVLVLLILMLLFVLGVVSVSVVGIGNPATATFLLNLGLTLASASAHILVLLLTVRQLPTEIENRTIYPLLARPLAREYLLIGKWVACAGCGILVFTLMFLLGWTPVPKMELYYGSTLIQALTLQLVSLACLAALSTAFSLVAPRGVAIVVLGGWYFLGDKLAGLLNGELAGTALASVAKWFSAYLPDFTKLNMLTRYTDGIEPLSLSVFAGLLAYGALFMALGLGAGTTIFSRKAL